MTSWQATTNPAMIPKDNPSMNITQPCHVAARDALACSSSDHHLPLLNDLSLAKPRAATPRLSEPWGLVLRCRPNGPILTHAIWEIS